MNVEWGFQANANQASKAYASRHFDDPFATLHAPVSGPLAGNVQPFADAFQKIVNGLPEQIALLDEDWRILVVNEAWVKTAALYGFHALGRGTDYFRFCRDRAAEGHHSAAAVANGIASMIQDKQDSYRLTYSGSDRWEGHEFLLCINRVEMGSRRLASVTRYDVTELVKLRRMREEFSSSLIQGQNDERRRIAREIHDSTMQLLASIGLALGALKRTHEPDHASNIVTEIEGLLAETQREIRSISYLAHPPLLDELGLPKAVETMVDGYCRRTGLKLRFRSELGDGPVWRTAEAALYRVVQESLSNVHRHAHATEAAVGLFLRRSMIHAVVVDNGWGFPASIAPGVGLLSMRERIEELGGRLTIRAQHPGTAILASLPIKPLVRSVGDLAIHG